MPVEPANAGAGEGAFVEGALASNARPTQAKPTQPVPPKRPAQWLWAVLMARIHEVLPLLYPICGEQISIITFIMHSADILQILEHNREAVEPLRITPGTRAATVGRVQGADGRWSRHCARWG